MYNPTQGRLDVLDALRGLALFGILLANIRLFAGWDFMNSATQITLAGPWGQTYNAINTFIVDGKFYTLFSLLFGIGFALQLSRLETGGNKAVMIYVRRLLILLFMGFIHLTCFWFGDIIATYAVLGFLLLAIHRVSDRTVLILAVVAFLFPLLGYLVAWKLGAQMDLGFYGLGMAIMSGNISGFQGDLVAVIGSERWSDFFAFNNGGALLRIGYILESWRLPKLVFVMLIGLWCGRQIVQGKLINDNKFLSRVAIIGLTLGIIAGIFYARIGPVFAFAGPADITGLARMTLYMLSVFPLGFAYGALFVLAWNNRPALVKFLCAPGRMALTNYLSQTAISVAIFYGIGFGFVAQAGPIAMIGTAIAIFAGQILFSTLWLRAFKYGPLEWLWRCGTYGKLLPLAKS